MGVILHLLVCVGIGFSPAAALPLAFSWSFTPTVEAHIGMVELTVARMASFTFSSIYSSLHPPTVSLYFWTKIMVEAKEVFDSSKSPVFYYIFPPIVSILSSDSAIFTISCNFSSLLE